jgi:hypothetical protein
MQDGGGRRRDPGQPRRRDGATSPQPGAASPPRRWLPWLAALATRSGAAVGLLCG